jgi:hypothetical protein
VRNEVGIYCVDDVIDPLLTCLLAGKTSQKDRNQKEKFTRRKFSNSNRNWREDDGWSCVHKVLL